MEQGILNTAQVKALIDRLREFAQNEEMIDQYYTDHGMDCNSAARELELMLDKERVQTLS